MKFVNIPCPCCRTSIPLNPERLIVGESFKCSNCEAEISLSTESTETTRKALDQIKSLKKKSEGEGL